MTSSASDKLRLRQEIDILTKVKHPNIVRLLMSYEDLDNFIQVFEYLRWCLYKILSYNSWDN